MGEGQGLTEVKSVLTDVNKCMFGTIWLPDRSQKTLHNFRAEAKKNTGRSVSGHVNVLSIH